jgi:hypothetical protein
MSSENRINNKSEFTPTFETQQLAAAFQHVYERISRARLHISRQQKQGKEQQQAKPNPI